MIRRIRSLRIAANIALIFASIAVVANNSIEMYYRFRPAAAQPRATTAPRPERVPFQPGIKAPVVPGVDYRKSDRTMVMFLSTHCKYCEMSVPFYRELSGSLASKKGARRLVAVFPQTAEEVKAFIDKEKLAVETVAVPDLDTFGIGGTPTLLLVARDGTVIRSWVGAPQPQVKEAITAAFL